MALGMILKDLGKRFKGLVVVARFGFCHTFTIMVKSSFLLGFI